MIGSTEEARVPALLTAYRAVSRGEAVDDWDAWVVELKLAHPRQFSMDLARYEREWAEVEARRVPAGPVEAGPGPVDVGEGLKLAEKWLGEQGLRGSGLSGG